jgi:hypothetical protein
VKTLTVGSAGGPRKFFQVLLCGGAALLWVVAGAANPALGDYPNRTKTTGRPDASPAFTESSDGKQDLATDKGGRFNLSIFLQQRPAAFSIVNVTHHEDKPGATTSYVFTNTNIGATTPAAIPAQALNTSTPTPTPPTTPAQLQNISTRARVLTGDNVLIGGFIITGTDPKRVIVRALGPSIKVNGTTISGALQDPTLELHSGNGTLLFSNDDWRDAPNAAEIQSTGLAPPDDRESAILMTLVPGNYTTIVRGKNGTGIGLVEVYDLDTAATSKLANLSTRAFVDTGNNVVIAGFVLGNNSGNDHVVIRGLGPSLSSFGIPGALADPTLELRDDNGTLLIADDDWQDNGAQAAEIIAAGLAPCNPKESAIAATLPPGSYTAILRGVNNGTGVGLVEVYDRGDGSGVPPPPPPPCPTTTATATPTATPIATATATPTATPTATATATPTATSCTEDFDGVTAPALPPGWVASNAAGSAPLWATSPTIPDTAPNDAVVKDSPEISDKRLDTPGIAIASASAQLSFRNNFSLQDGFDGGVLEVSSPNIAGGAFTDITNAAVGGSFVSGGYTGTISPTQGSPVAGRMAWSGNSGGYISTVVNLGPNVQGQTIKLRFRLATDQAVAGGGWRIDTISIVGGACP